MTLHAIFSLDKRYRYTLHRDIGPGKGVCTFIMLNPSTADDEKLDPTCTRCRNYASKWGYSRLTVLNVYAYRSTDPRGLWTVDDPVGPNNLRHIREQCARSHLVVCAWGAHAKAEHVEPVVAIVRATGSVPMCLGVTKAGAPRHPLYLRGDLEPIGLLLASYEVGGR